MSKIRGRDRLGRLIHRTLHDLARKYKVDVAVVAAVVSDYTDAIHESLVFPSVRKLRSRNYPCIIEVLVPVRFYWHQGGFDGLEAGPLKEGFTAYQGKLLSFVLDAVGGHGEVPIVRKRKTPIPRAFKDVFKGGAS